MSADPPPPGTVLCALADLPEPGAREVVPDGFRVIVVRHGGLLRAYRNLCPHFGLPLNIRPDQFLDVAGERLLCRAHFAQFRIADGLCVRGPCQGRALRAVPVAARDGQVVIADE
jgi:nitrite reductase/ring-hydroxylating ferredoxin subunit